MHRHYTPIIYSYRIISASVVIKVFFMIQRDFTLTTCSLSLWRKPGVGQQQVQQLRRVLRLVRGIQERLEQIDPELHTAIQTEVNTTLGYQKRRGPETLNTYISILPNRHIITVHALYIYFMHSQFSFTVIVFNLLTRFSFNSAVMMLNFS